MSASIFVKILLLQYAFENNSTHENRTHKFGFPVAQLRVTLSIELTSHAKQKYKISAH